MKSVYVGNLSYKVTSDMLKSVFEEFGEVVSSKVVADFDGRSKGFGFVEMADAAAAERAIKELDGAELNGRNIKVNLAKPKSEGGPRNSNGGGNFEKKNRW